MEDLKNKISTIKEYGGGGDGPDDGLENMN